MAMNKQRRTANINNIVTYDTIGNVTLPADLTIEGLTGAGFVKADANGLLSVDTAAYVTLNSTLSGYVVGPDSAISSSDTIIQAFGKIQGQLDALPNSNVITGTLSTGQVAYGSAANTIAGSNNLFWDNANGRLGIGTNAPATRLRVLDNVNNVAATFGGGNATPNWVSFGTVNSGALPYIQGINNASTANTALAINGGGGNVLIGTYTDGGQRLQVQGDAFIKGSGNTSATTALTVQNSDGTNIFRVRNDGTNILGSFSESPTFYPSDANGNLSIGGACLAIDIRNTGNGRLFIKGANTTQQTSIVELIRTFNPSTAVSFTFTGINLTPTINQTGGANGITRGLYVNPTLTAAADWRSIEWSNNTGWGLYGSGTANNYMAGSLGIATTGLTQYAVRVAKSITGATTSYGLSIESAVQSDVTSSANIFHTNTNTQAATFTLSNLRHYNADQGSFGAGSTITNQFGFVAQSSLIGAINNYGFYGNIASGTGRWNLYMNGTADNFLNGPLGIGSVALSNFAFRIQKNLTGGTSVFGASVNSTVQSDATSQAFGYHTNINTQAASFTLPNLYHFASLQGAIGSGSAVTNQYGFFVDSSLTGATNNYGFWGNIASGSNRWNLYMSGTANNYMAGSLGVGATNLPAHSLRIARNITGATTSYGATIESTIQSDVTSNANLYFTSPATQAAAFTLVSLRHYYAIGVSIGASSSVTNQYGFVVDNSLTTATNNFGFYGDIASATGRWNLYCNGTAPNFMAGSLGIGTTSLGNYSLRITRNTTGATSAVSVGVESTISSDVTSVAYGYLTSLATQASSFTLSEIRHFNALQGTFGAGSTVTVQSGFLVASNMVGATNNYGFRGLIPSGTGRWNIYMDGTAANYLNGNTIIGGSAVDNGQKLQVNGDTLMVGSGNTSATTALTINNSDGTNLVRIQNNGMLTFNATGSTLSIYGQQNASVNTSSNAGFAFRSSLSGTTAGPDFDFLNGQANSALTAGGGIVMRLTRTFEPTSGTATYTTLQINQTINQTGGANGITRGLYVTPTLTASADWRSIEWSNNTGWGLYGASANNFLGGSLGIGSTALTQYSLRVSKNITGGTIAFGIAQSGTVQSGVTSAAIGYYNGMNIQAAAFTVPTYTHYYTEQGTIGAGSIITTQRGFFADATLIGAANNFGFVGSIPSGTGRWNLYMDGTANNYMAGSLGIGSTTLTASNFRVTKAITGNTTFYNINSDGIIQSDVTNSVNYFRTSASTQAATFTLSGINHYAAEQGTFGAGSTVTNQYGFLVQSSLTGATNNYGFFGNIASGTGRWNIYMDGTANNYMAGSLGIGTTNITNQNVFIAKTLSATGLNFAVSQVGIVQSAATSAFGFYNSMQTQAASFTLSNYYHFNADQGTIGAGSTVNNQYGFVYSSTATGALNNYAFRSSMASGTGRWNVYMDGTAANYLNGNTIIGGSATDGGQKLQVNGTGIFTDTLTANVGVRIGTGSSLAGVYVSAGTPSGTEGVTIRSGLPTTTIGSDVVITAGQGDATHTSSIKSLLTLSRGYNPTSGSGFYNLLNIQPPINQTGGANGITRGVYINPTLTSAAEWRSIETSNNSGWSYYGAGTAASYFGGDVEIGTTTGVRRLNIFSSTGDTHVAVLGTAPSVALSDTATGATYQAKFGLATAANNFVTGSAAGDFVISNQAGNTIWAYNSVEGMRFTVNRNLLLGGTSDSGKKLQVTGEVNVTSGNATSIEISNTAGNYHLLMSSVSVAASYGMYISGSDMLFTKTGAASPNITIKSTNGDVVFGNTIKTAAPTGGTSQAWKLGQYNATAPSATGYVEVEVNGVLYKLLAST